MLVRRQSLVFDSQAPSKTDISAPPITDANPSPTPITATPETTAINTLISSPSPSSSVAVSTQQQPGAASVSSRSSINLSTVIGACLGSFALLILIVMLVVWHSRRAKNTDYGSRHFKRENWKKLNNNRDSHRSSFESKPSLPPLSFDTVEYPPSQPRSQRSHFHHVTIDNNHQVHPSASTFSKRHSATPDNFSSNNPFVDPKCLMKSSESDSVSLYSNSSNPFESVYTPPVGTSTRMDSPQHYTGSGLFAPHPDSSVQGEKWGSVGKERNVQEAVFLNDPNKFGSLIAALDLNVRLVVEENVDTAGK